MAILFLQRELCLKRSGSAEALGFLKYYFKKRKLFFSSPILLEDIATLNRQLHLEVERGQRRVASMHGSLELEALAAVHELATHVYFSKIIFLFIFII